MNYESWIERGDPNLERSKRHSLTRLAELEREETQVLAQVRGRGVPPSLTGNSGQHGVALGSTVPLLGLHRSETPAPPGNNCAPNVQCLKLVSIGHSEPWAAGTRKGQMHGCVISTALGWAAETVVPRGCPRDTALSPVLFVCGSHRLSHQAAF